MAIPRVLLTLFQLVTRGLRAIFPTKTRQLQIHDLPSSTSAPNTSLEPVPYAAFAPPLNIHQQYHYLHHSPCTIFINRVFYFSCESRASENYATLPLYTTEINENGKKDPWISSKTIAMVAIAVVIALISMQCDYTGCSPIPSPVFWPYHVHFNAFVILIVLAFATSGTGPRLGDYFPLLGKFMEEMGVIVLSIAFGLAIWFVLPLHLRWVSWVSLLPVLSRLVLQSYKALLHYFDNWVKKSWCGEA
ncbi:hypothetical protein AMTR_s00072p00123230 [Amborella trichopoda]|uniref:PGG domain-containing protein n=1 Tax=Amborella trichopoda TaxID=13333 RepID=W1NPA9_AMBTC|nr:hypothetical protein AMTR_s00072p00123230 [Amborella trichopoda]